MPKVILIDAGSLYHSAIFAWGRDFLKYRQGQIKYLMPSDLNYYQMLIGCLKKIHVEKDDIIIIAEEGKSWRKKLSGEYKGNRQDLKKLYPHIDFPKHYKKINELHKQLNKTTAFQFKRAENLEADDLIALATKKFSDKECIIVSLDGDLKQLCARPNVKFLSFYKKYNGTRGCYIEIKNPYKILHDKIDKGDKSDNIIVEDKNDENERKIRETLVNLLELPKDIEQEGMKVLANIEKKDYILSEIPYKNSRIGKRFPQIFDKKYKINYEESINYKKKKRRTK